MDKVSLSKNQLHTVTIENWSADGAGVCRIDGRAVFVKGAIPGERWVVRILKVTNTAVFARGEELLEPSPERITPDCPVFGKCGGCVLRHVTYEEELRFKLSRVNEAYRRIAGLPLVADEIIGGESVDSYRNKAIYDDFDLILRMRKAGKKIAIRNVVLANFKTGGVSNEKSIKKCIRRIRIRYNNYRNNGYSPLYIFESVAMEVAKLILS